MGPTRAAPRRARHAGRGHRKKLTARIDWLKSQDGARKLSEGGFGRLVAPAADVPALDPLAEQAMHCWRFCGGWAPERWPVYHTFYPVADWHALIDAMQEIQRHAR